MNQILRVAKMHYEGNLSQQDIAALEEISPATVSRLIKKAGELGFIKIIVDQPIFSTVEIETELKDRFGLKKVTVIPDLINNEKALERDINRALIEDLNKLIQDGDTIGLAWGNTVTSLAEEARSFKPFDKKDINVVQLYGGISPLLNDSGSTDSIQSIARLLNGDAYQICAPAYVDNKDTAELFRSESQISSILEMGKGCDIAIFSSAPVDKTGFIFTLGSLKEDDIRSLDENRAIGDICIHFLNEKGEIADQQLDERVIGLSLEEIKQIPEKILIAYGEHRAEIVRALLEKGFVNRFYTDEKLAKRILES